MTTGTPFGKVQARLFPDRVQQLRRSHVDLGSFATGSSQQQVPPCQLCRRKRNAFLEGAGLKAMPLETLG
jgi:hypothetical protein